MLTANYNHRREAREGGKSLQVVALRDAQLTTLFERHHARGAQADSVPRDPVKMMKSMSTMIGVSDATLIAVENH
jgi:hypothetical protein